jgi:hypothetical protein
VLTNQPTADVLTPAQRAWVDDLRSGKFKQTFGILTQVNDDGSRSHCCLGIACERAVAEGIIPPGQVLAQDQDALTYVGEDDDEVSVALLGSPAIRDYFGFKDENPHFTTPDGDRIYLSDLNDSGRYTFEDIADLVEANAAELFR